MYACQMAPAIPALDVRPLSTLFQALGDEVRVRMVALLAHGELCVCHLEEALKLTQPTASRHLAVLRNAGVVESRRQGQWIHYRLAHQPDELRQSQLRSLVSDLGQRAVLRRDLTRLLKARGPGACS